MKKFLFLFLAFLMSVTIVSARERSYGPTTLIYDDSTETNSYGVASVIVVWDKENAKGINVVGTVKVGDQEKSFRVSGHNGKYMVYFRNLVPEKRYSIEWDFIDPTDFPE